MALLPLAVSGAEFSHAVVVQFKGQLLAFAEFPEVTGSDQEIVAQLKAARLTELKGEPGAEDATRWAMKFLVFPQAAATGKRKVEFYDQHKFVTDYLLPPDMPAHATSYEIAFTLGEDEGLSKGKEYIIKLVDVREGSPDLRERVLARTTLTLR